MKKGSSRIVIPIIVIAVIGLLGYLAFSGDSSKNDNPDGALTVVDNNTTASSSVTEEGTSLTGVGITVDDQNPGKIVVVSQVFLNSPAWVVIYENNNGTPGNLLGARLFEKGNNSGIIQLLGSMKVNGSYLAVVQTDNGDGVIDIKKDPILKGTDGKNIQAAFKATVGSDKPQ